MPFWIVIAAVICSSIQAEPVSEREQLAQAVRQIFESRCSECHGPATQKAGLDLGRLSKLKASGLLNPGNPAESELYRRISPGGGMPQGGQPLSPIQQEMILQWITVGAPDVAEFPAVNVTKSEATVSAELMTADAILTDVKYLRDRNLVRYLTLTHLVNAGATEAEIRMYRQGLNKLFNSLSWSKSLIELTPIDSAGTILRLNLKDIEWNEAQWELVATQNPYRIEFDEFVYEMLRQAIPSTQTPYLRGDWFAKAVTEPKLYHAVVLVPETLEELEQKLAVQSLTNFQTNRVLRLGIPKGRSGVSSNNRILERHPGKYGAYWKSFDFASNEGASDIFQNPLPPLSGTRTFEHAGGEIIFTLPNGLQGYMLINAQGKRLDVAPITIVSDKTASDTQIYNGISCMGCHQQGIIQAKDHLFEYISQNRGVFQEDLTVLLKQYRSSEVVSRQIEADRKHFLSSLEAIGVHEDSGPEKIRALVNRFDRNVTLTDATAELGLTESEFRRAAQKDATLQALVNRLEGPAIPRDSFNIVFKDTIVKLGIGKLAKTKTQPQVAGEGNAKSAIPNQPSNARTPIGYSGGYGSTNGPRKGETFREYHERNTEARLRAIAQDRRNREYKETRDRIEEERRENDRRRQDLDRRWAGRYSGGPNAETEDGIFASATPPLRLPNGISGGLADTLDGHRYYIVYRDKDWVALATYEGDSAGEILEGATVEVGIKFPLTEFNQNLHEASHVKESVKAILKYAPTLSGTDVELLRNLLGQIDPQQFSDTTKVFSWAVDVRWKSKSIIESISKQLSHKASALETIIEKEKVYLETTRDLRRAAEWAFALTGEGIHNDPEWKSLNEKEEANLVHASLSRAGTELERFTVSLISRQFQVLAGELFCIALVQKALQSGEIYLMNDLQAQVRDLLMETMEISPEVIRRYFPVFSLRAMAGGPFFLGEMGERVKRAWGGEVRMGPIGMLLAFKERTGAIAYYPTVDKPSGTTEEGVLIARHLESLSHGLFYIAIGDGERRLINEYWPNTRPLTTQAAKAMKIR